MVESPQDDIYLAVDQSNFSDSDDPLTLKQSTVDSKLPELEAELLLVKRPLITSSFRSATRHLIAQGGSLAIFRGLGVFAFSGIIAQFAREFLQVLFVQTLGMPFPISASLSTFLAKIAINRFLLTWTHIVISQPSSKWWSRRLPSFRTARKALPATALWAFTEQLSISLPLILACGLGLHRDLSPGEARDGLLTMDERTAKMILLKSFAVFFVGITTYFLVWIPANVTLTRVQASLLPETDAPIVPFDRTFKGKFIPESMGGSGKLGLLDAWRTFDWVARRRLLKLIVKLLALDFGAGLFFGLVILGELRLVMGDQYDQLMMVVNAWLYGLGGQ